ncbi:flavodoxin [Acidaminobacter sp. JC074]|uniref:flavodoxin domain-containing protein n=1 Tax=Acidaminobacter sp. JC074 TaxID=2530199 RepID=UPI001F0D83B0|nr:flavodoxin domain-containing protein [Acidaminobacter sp. JC074]MCH4886543.1 flavodoxin [Acidaminobacter sp. JC074]
MKVLIAYGSTTGTTENVAGIIKNHLNHETQVMNISNLKADDVKAADTILLGSSTWGYGELQDDFADYMDQIDEATYRDKNVAVFGCGDADGFADVFCEAVNIITEKLESVGANLVTEPLKISGMPEDNLGDIETFALNI